MSHTDFVTIHGVQLCVEYDYFPPEPEYHGDNGCSPGSRGEYDITSVKFAGFEIMPLLSDDAFTAIEEALDKVGGGA